MEKKSKRFSFMLIFPLFFPSLSWFSFFYFFSFLAEGMEG